MTLRLAALVVCALPLGCDRPAPPPPPPPPAQDDSKVKDDVEERVFELEDMFERHRAAMVQFSPDQAVGIFADDFTGDVWFDDAPWEPDLALPHVATFKRGAGAPSRHADLAAKARAFLARFDRIDALTIKFESPEVVKFTLAARKDGLVTEIFERSAAAFTKDCRIASLQRLGGTRKQATRQAFVDATSVLGLALDPAIDCHACAYAVPFDDAGGVAAGDYDNDGDLDLFATRIGPPALFRNDGGRFTNVTAAAGLDRKMPGAGAIWLDADNDGRLDLLMTCICQPKDACGGCAVVLFRNKGDGTFEDVTERALGRSRGPAHSACAADIDGDGDLDIFVAMYGESAPLEGLPSVRVLTRSFVAARDGKPDLLFVNKGDGTFEERGAKAGVADTGWGLACLFFDHGADGKPDLYVVNDFGPHVFYKNRGDGTFEERPLAQDMGFGMGVCGGDFDRDGDLDLHVSNMYSSAGNRVLARSGELPDDLRKRLLKFAQGNSLLRCDGASFVECAVPLGCANAGWAWGPVFLDYDEDGWPDLYVANGYRSARARKDL